MGYRVKRIKRQVAWETREDSERIPSDTSNGLDLENFKCQRRLHLQTRTASSLQKREYFYRGTDNYTQFLDVRIRISILKLFLRVNFK